MTFKDTCKENYKNSSYIISSKKLNFRLQWLKKVLSKTQNSCHKIPVTKSQTVLSKTQNSGHKIPVTKSQTVLSKTQNSGHKIPVTKSQKVVSNTKFWLQYHKKFFQTQNSGYNITKSSFKHKILVTISQKVIYKTKNVR